ncbi:MAG: hypothetical protein QM770_22390 [Tepidisphaeraceae bacterium]
MTRATWLRARFAAWGVTIGLILALTPVAIVWRSRVALSIATTAWAGLVLLLLTTPADAIRLKPVRSVAFVSLGTAWLAAWGAMRGEMSIGVAIAIVTTALAGTLISARTRWSPWWVSVVAWCPAIFQ